MARKSQTSRSKSRVLQENPQNTSQHEAYWSKWWCTKKCNGRYAALGPLVPGRAHRSAKQVIKYLILYFRNLDPPRWKFSPLYVRGGRHKDAGAEVELSQQTIVSLRRWFDSLIATAHVRRRARNRSSISTMQCDETFFSVRK